MKQYEEVVERKRYICETKRILHLKCDSCGKIIEPSLYNEGKSEYIHVHTWHNDWGNDSVESHQYYEFCKGCAPEFVHQYVMKAHGSEKLELSRKWLSVRETEDGPLVPI